MRNAKAEEEKQEEERRRKEKRRRERRRSRRGSNVLGAVVRRDLKVDMPRREDMILEDDSILDEEEVRDDYVRGESVLIDSVLKEETVKDITIVKDEENCDDSESLSSSKIGEVDEQDGEENNDEEEEEMEPPPGLNYVMKPKNDTRSKVRFEESSDTSSSKRNVMFEKEEKTSSPSKLFRKRKDTENKKGSVLELFGVDKRDIATTIKSRYNRVSIDCVEAALSALQPMMDVLGRSSPQKKSKQRLSRPETLLSATSERRRRRYSRLDKLKDWKKRNN